MQCRSAGSPFQPYQYEGQTLTPGQANNVLMCAAGASADAHHTATFTSSTQPSVRSRLAGVHSVQAARCLHDCKHGERNNQQRSSTFQRLIL